MTRRMRFPAWLPILLGFLTAVGPSTTDMYLPAFPAIEASFGAPPGSAQLTLAAWFAGLAIGQMTQGTLSDRFGRKRPLIVATAIYTVACLGCALAPSVQWLATFRALSALGASAGMVIPRAMVRDLAEGHAAAVLLSRLSLVMGAAPILAPTVGSAVLAFADWRGNFWIHTAYGATCWRLVVLLLPDTLPEGQALCLKQIQHFQDGLSASVCASANSCTATAASSMSAASSRTLRWGRSRRSRSSPISGVRRRFSSRASACHRRSMR